MAGRKKSNTTDTEQQQQKQQNKTNTKKKIVRRKKSEIGLYEIIKKKTNINKILDEWIDRYNDKPEESVWELLLLIFDSAGAATTISFEQFRELEIDEAAKQICDQEDEQHFPLSSKRSKNFINNFNEFWRQIILKTQKSILFDHYLLDMLVLWFIETSQGKRRGLRYASTLASIQMVNSIIEVSVELRNELNIVTRQLASETKNTNRQKQLKDNQTNIQGKLENLETTLTNKMLISIFHTRFKDSLPEIRSMCLQPLSQWILRYPIKLLNDEYLKYFGWALNDFSNEPRLAALQGLLHLYSDEDRIHQFENFTHRFKHRIVDIAFSDKVPQICIKGIELVNVMSSFDLLDEPDVIKICKLYQIDQIGISKASGNLIYHKFLLPIQNKIDLIQQEQQQKEKDSGSGGSKTVNKRKRNNNGGDDTTSEKDESNSQQILHLRENQLNTLLEFLEKISHSDIPYYLVYSLWETKAKDLFLDWSFWVDYLESIEAKNITDKQLSIIVQFLSSSIKIATGDKLKLFGSSDSNSTNASISTELASTQQQNNEKKKSGRLGRKSVTPSKKSDVESELDDGDDSDQEQQPQEESESNTNAQILSDELQLNEEICIQVTTNFLNILPELIVQHRADSLIVEHLIEIAKYFVLDCYVTLRSQSKYGELLEAICSICISQPRIELINTISETLDHLINNGKTPSQLETVSKNSLHTLHTELIDQLRLAKISASNSQSSLSSIPSSTTVMSDDHQKKQDNQIFQVISTLSKLDSLGKRFYFDDEKYASLIFRFTDGSINGVPVETQDDSDSIVMLSLSIYSQLLMWSFFRIIPEKPYLVQPTDLSITKSFYLLVSRSILHLKDENATPKLKHFVFTQLIETRSLFSPILDLTALNTYNIGLPIEKLLQKTIKELLKIENQYSLRLLKVEYLKNQQSIQEKKKQSSENRSARRGNKSSNKKSDSTGAGGVTDDETTTGAITTNSERDTSATDHETESDGNEINHQILEDEIELIKTFQIDPEYSKRMEDFSIAICNSIRFSFVSELMVKSLLKQIAISSSKSCTDIIRQFIKERSSNNPKVELEIVCSLIASFHKICISDLIKTNKDLQNHMFSRFRSLCQYLVNDFIKNRNTLRDVIEHFLNFALKNESLAKLDQLLEIIQFLCSKLSEESSIDILKKKLIFPDEYQHLEIIKNIYNTIEFQTIQNMEVEGNDGKKKKLKKQQLKFTRKPIGSNTSSSKTNKKRRRRSSKNISSEEESESESESEIEQSGVDDHSIQKNKNITQDDDDTLLTDDIDPDQIRESSEDSSDFEPPELSKKKLKK